MEDGKKRGKKKGRVAQQMEKEASLRAIAEASPAAAERVEPQKANAWKWAPDGRLLVMTDAEEPVEFRPGKYDEDRPTLLYVGLSRLQELALDLGSGKMSVRNGTAKYEDCFKNVSWLNDGIRETEEKTLQVAEKFCEMMEPEGLAQLFDDDTEALIKVTMEGLERMM